ncbi:LytR/AlgR family response regulator transcription factor [Petrimonas sp.]|uniref:LytR/AlgR family response regulator transcription factor n=1 Tax=Petrimonas sp. TaxID=2023866 RepID=UPI003F5178C2
MKAVIVEDEHVAAQSLERLIKSVDEEIEILAVLPTVEESVEWFSQNTLPDVVFMDIHLADGDSFSIFEHVELQCPIIFTTAYDEYALKAFEVNSIDYLLKPINLKKLEKALDKLNRVSFDDNSDKVARLIRSFFQTQNVYQNSFLIPVKDKLIPVPADDIAFVYSEYKMAKIVCFNRQSYTMDISLNEFYKQLNPVQFFRANRQFIVSRRAVTDLSVWFDGKLLINLSVAAPEKIILSRARTAEFKNWYMSPRDSFS